MSSAHVYVRLNKGQTMDDMSEGLLEDCAQLVKANSIQGWTNYRDNIISQILALSFLVRMWNIIQAIVWHMWWFLHFGAGNKVNNIDVVYTPWYNLKKTPSMDVGQVGFHNPKLVRAHQLFFCSLFLQQDYVHMLLYVPWQTLYALYGCGSKCVIHASDRVP